MKIKSHIKVADYLLSEINGKNRQIINKHLFRLGSIMPDISPNLRFMHHHFLRNKDKLKKYKFKIELTDSSLRLSYILGKLTHYISDSFLLVHNIDFKSNLVFHRKYENMFSKYIKENLPITDTYFKKSNLNIECIVNVLFEHLGEYLKSYTEEEISAENFENDLLYIIHINTEVINVYINEFRIKEALI